MRFFGSISIACFLCIGAVADSGRAADFFAAYCLKCHGEDPEKLEGETDLRRFEEVLSRDLLLNVIEQIDSGEMPTKAPYPTPAEREAAIASLEKSLAKLPPPELPSLRRLTREEYQNTMRDLIGIDLKAGEFLPADGQGGSGFSNDRIALSLGPNQLETLFSAAERALDGVFALAGGDVKVSEFFAAEMTRSSAGVKPHLDGMMVVQPTHFLEAMVHFPVDGFYLFSMAGGVIGEPCVAEFYADGEVVAEVKITSTNLLSAEVASAVGFVRRGTHAVKVGSKNLVPQSPEPPNLVQLADERAQQNAARLGPLENESPESKTLREALNEKGYGMQESIEFLRVFGRKGDSRKIDLHRKYYHERQEDWQRILSQLAVESGVSESDLMLRWKKENADRIAENEATLGELAGVRWEDWMRHQGKIYAEKLTVSGPVLNDRPSGNHDWNLLSAINDLIDPIALVKSFAEQAFRRPVSDTEIEPYTQIVLEAQRREEERDRAVKLALATILVSPEFLYRGQEPGNWGVASRLSYFLWLSKPDIALQSANLSDPNILNKEIDRLVVDPRSDAFFRSFTDEWLELDGMDPDRTLWPEFSPEIAEAMRDEARSFIADLFRTNETVSALLLSDKSFVGKPLNDFFKLQGESVNPAVSSLILQKPERFGLLGKSAVLVATSSPTRTNPVRRGKWVWENLLGKSAGTPLPDAGELPGDAGTPRGKTLREELAAHRSSAECARCHDKIDPIGFGLQNFDATGRWRETEAGKPVDARGELAGGGSFSGPIELRQLLLEKHGQDIAKNVARRLEAYFNGGVTHRSFRSLTAETRLLDLLKQVIEN